MIVKFSHAETFALFQTNCYPVERFLTFHT